MERPQDASDVLPLKTPVVAVTVDGDRTVYPVPVIYEQAGDDGVWIRQQADHTVRIRTGQSPTVFVDVTPASASVEVVHAYWFAWHANHPEDVPVS